MGEKQEKNLDPLTDLQAGPWPIHLSPVTCHSGGGGGMLHTVTFPHQSLSLSAGEVRRCDRSREVHKLTVKPTALSNEHNFFCSVFSASDRQDRTPPKRCFGTRVFVRQANVRHWSCHTRPTTLFRGLSPFCCSATQERLRHDNARFAVMVLPGREVL